MPADDVPVNFLYNHFRPAAIDDEEETPSVTVDAVQFVDVRFRAESNENEPSP